MRRTILILATLASLIVPAFAVEPGEMLADPAMEARARALSRTLRCMVCQNESIDDSHAPLAKDLRVLVRERIAAGDSDAQVRDFLIARYGDFILLEPRLSGRTWLLWGLPLLVFVLGGAGMFVSLSRPKKEALKALSADEQKRLQSLLQQNKKP